jgi:hypothetical protein
MTDRTVVGWLSNFTDRDGIQRTSVAVVVLSVNATLAGL